MTKAVFITVLTGLIVLFDCPAFGDTVALAQWDSAAQKTAAESWRTNRLALGKEIYDQACFTCHDSGLDGAPIIGDQGAWSERSPLWSAVLFEHSRAGYLDMPAKGAHPELTDQEVDAASEYMLSLTFPELPLD